MYQEKNIGEKLGYIGFGDEFLDITSKAQLMSVKIGKMDFTKIKNICFMKDTLKRIKRQAKEWG